MRETRIWVFFFQLPFYQFTKVAAYFLLIGYYIIRLMEII